MYKGKITLSFSIRGIAIDHDKIELIFVSLPCQIAERRDSFHPALCAAAARDGGFRSPVFKVLGDMRSSAPPLQGAGGLGIGYGVGQPLRSLGLHAHEPKRPQIPRNASSQVGSASLRSLRFGDRNV